MRSRIWNVRREHLGISLKCGSVFFLFLISVLVVACGANNTAAAPSDPPVTVTINLNQTFASPTPPQAPYSCGAWATVSTPVYNPGSTIQVYAKFVQNVDGNPVGMASAHANATFFWPSDPQTNVSATTTSDGLAVFSTPILPSAVNHVVLVEVNFTSADNAHGCSVTRKDNNAAFFTAIEVSPTVMPTSPGGLPPCPTVLLQSLCVTPSPSATKTPHGG